jgi:hypothetical protein
MASTKWVCSLRWIGSWYTDQPSYRSSGRTRVCSSRNTDNAADTPSPQNWKTMLQYSKSFRVSRPPPSERSCRMSEVSCWKALAQAIYLKGKTCSKLSKRPAIEGSSSSISRNAPKDPFLLIVSSLRRVMGDVLTRSARPGDAKACCCWCSFRSRHDSRGQRIGEKARILTDPTHLIIGSIIQIILSVIQGRPRHHDCPTANVHSYSRRDDAT